VKRVDIATRILPVPGSRIVMKRVNGRGEIKLLVNALDEWQSGP